MCTLKLQGFFRSFSCCSEAGSVCAGETKLQILQYVGCSMISLWEWFLLVGLPRFYGTPMYILCRKLKLLKGPLKELNRLHFSHISERVSRLESQLDQLQTVFQQDRDKPVVVGAGQAPSLQTFFPERGPRLPSHLQDALLAPVAHDEIRRVVFSIANEKAPGPDGPISCCNVIYKVLSKILASRFAQVLHEMVSPMQNAFLGGRYMSDNINLVQELLRQYCRKRSSPRCLLKVDFKKAFDSVQWDFLESLLCHLGFPAHFVVLVMQCISSASYSVAVNGDLHGFFSGQCGVRQGDPLSPRITPRPPCGKPSSRLGRSSLNIVGAQRWRVSL
uniref:Reverse transcriptase domain-containing protein n=1 Tax=Populus alba TaxID=43335 RepID=A0A4U5NRJ7_POPAL|nr:hypothetical protein D5086_0000248420 [Populus alba]